LPRSLIPNWECKKAFNVSNSSIELLANMTSSTYTSNIVKVMEVDLMNIDESEVATLYLR